MLTQLWCHARCFNECGPWFLANLWQMAVGSAPGMQEAGYKTRPELLVCGGAPRRNRTGDPILTIRAAALLYKAPAGQRTVSVHG